MFGLEISLIMHWIRQRFVFFKKNFKKFLLISRNQSEKNQQLLIWIKERLQAFRDFVDVVKKYQVKSDENSESNDFSKFNSVKIPEQFKMLRKEMLPMIDLESERGDEQFYFSVC